MESARGVPRALNGNAIVLSADEQITWSLYNERRRSAATTWSRSSRYGVLPGRSTRLRECDFFYVDLKFARLGTLSFESDHSPGL